MEYYNENEKSKLDNYSTAEKIRSVVNEGVTISTAEFLTYYLFHKKRPGKFGWRNYEEVGCHIDAALAELSGWVEFNGYSISTPNDVDPQDRAITERIGESIGLSVISKIHELTAADWGKIPEGKTKTFDYEIASDGMQIVQMEAKGSCTPDNSVKTDSIRKQKSSIADKKSTILPMENDGAYDFPADVRYGTIGVMGEQPTVPVRCYLVDPAAENYDDWPRRLRVLQRVRFIRDWISFISPRSQLAAALNTRFAALEKLSDPLLLDDVPLLGGRGEPLAFNRIGGTQVDYSSFFASKSRITDGPAGGITLQLPNDDLFFIGVREALVEMAAGQQLTRIAEFKTESGSMRKTVRCVFPIGAYRRLRLPSHIEERVSKSGKYFWFEMSGEIYHSDTGILFGVLPLHEAIK